MIFTTAFREKMPKDKGSAGEIPIGRAVPANLPRVISTPAMERRCSVGGGHADAHDAHYHQEVHLLSTLISPTPHSEDKLSFYETTFLSTIYLLNQVS